jgi:non-heme chloroperoxidase
MTTHSPSGSLNAMPSFTTPDGVDLHYKDWGDGPAVILSHGWPVNADMWESTQLWLAHNGFRVIAHDRRGHGRSAQVWAGNDMDHYADDLAALIDHLDLDAVSLVGWSTGGAEVVRYIGRHGDARVARLALIASVTPFLLRTEDNPDGIPIEAFDGFRAGSLADRAELYRTTANDLLFGAGAGSVGQRDAVWSMGMASGHHNAYECIAAFSETDVREDLRAIRVPTLIVHGDADEIAPLAIAGLATAELVPHAELKVYAGAPHGLTYTHGDVLNGDLLDFLQA